VDGQEFHAFAEDIDACCEPLPLVARGHAQRFLAAAS
jgi:hypothetical protein